MIVPAFVKTRGYPVGAREECAVWSDNDCQRGRVRGKDNGLRPEVHGMQPWTRLRTDGGRDSGFAWKPYWADNAFVGLNVISAKGETISLCVTAIWTKWAIRPNHGVHDGCSVPSCIKTPARGAYNRSVQ